MSDKIARKVPLAPYPPIVPKRMETGRDRSRSSASSQLVSNHFASVNNPSSRSPISNHSSRRQHPARVEFYSSDIYGAVNCNGHNRNAALPHRRVNSVQSVQTPNTLSRKNKLGPILLELRCLTRRPEEEGNSDDNITTNSRSIFSCYQGRTIAISRGISSSSVTSSTCLSFRKHEHAASANLSNEEGKTMYCATGLSSGVLAIHTLRNIHEYANMSTEEDGKDEGVNVLDSANSDDIKINYFSHHQTRHHRASSAVAWKCNSNSGSHSNHVAIGYSSSHGDRDRAINGQRNSSSTQRPVSDAHHGGFAFVWDVEAQSHASKGVKQVPLHKLAHNSSVASLSWIPGGQTLAIGCQTRNLQIHDLGISGTSVISVYAHDNSVNGIEFDPYKPNVFATFSRGLAEPVKLWDVRKMDSCVAEIKTHATQSFSKGKTDKELPSFVSAIAWDTSSEGTLSIAVGNELKFYNTRVNLSRPILSHKSHSDGPLQCMIFPPKDKTISENKNHPLIPQRILAVYNNGSVTDLPIHQVSPVALSSRDGRVASALGSHLSFGSTTKGPSAMETSAYKPSEDISATMMRRARCLHMGRYSTDATSNLQMLSLEQEAFLLAKDKSLVSSDEDRHLMSLEHLHLLWSWIERVESLCFRNSYNSAIDELFWPAKTLCDAGVLRLLRLDVANVDEITTFDSSSKSEVFNRDIYDSPLRRAALTACGWNGKFGLKDVLVHTESFGHFERSAALACWHGDLGETVAALQRGAEHIRTKSSQEGELKSSGHLTSQYAETLELVAMCVAGYSNDADKESPLTKVWRNACKNLLLRPNLSEKSGSGVHSNYLRAICLFLMDESDLDKTLRDESLNLSDRVAFACVYLARKQLKEYLDSCVKECHKNGNLEGLLITGLNRKGIALLQSYIDSGSDIQTAALVSSRTILPIEWIKERIVCSEWLSSYREFLNKNQMWKSRAMFDVGRVELLRKLRDRQQADEQFVQNTQPINRVIRRTTNQIRSRMNASSPHMRQSDNPIPPFPPQIHARCNYCNTPLPLAKLRRQEKIANNWLSRQNPVLSCCPNPVCRKPLPRCSICLLPLGCLNPYMELRREGSRLPRGSHGQNRGEDLSALANMPFAEWFSWCTKCGHGGHAHHYVSWFKNHDVCPVSNCDCDCRNKFDCIPILKRPELSSNKTD